MKSTNEEDDGGGGSRYRMKARATAATATGERIVSAAIRLFSERLYDEVALADIASEAGVTVQTVLRRFGSKEDLLTAAIEEGTQRVRRERAASPVGDIRASIANLVEHYEIWGDRSLLFLAQEQRVEAMRRVTTNGRALHYDWVERVFGPWLDGRESDAHQRLRASLIAVTDVYVWKIMRRDLGLDRAAVQTAVCELVSRLLEVDTD